MNTILLLAALLSTTPQMGGLKDVNVVDGVLSGEISDRDPMLIWKLDEPIETTNNLGVSVKLKAAKKGIWQFYWKSASKPSFGGGRREVFDVAKTNEWVELKLRPLWFGEGKITAIRLDPPDNGVGRVEIADCSIVKMEGIRAPFMAEENPIVAFEAASTNIAYGTLVWHRQGDTRKRMVAWTTAADGAKRTYWFDLSSDDLKSQAKAGGEAWKGIIDYFEVERVLDGEAFPVQNLRFLKERPNLGVDLGFTSVLPSEAIPRAGRPFPLEIIVRNYGTEVARNLRFAVDELPRGFEAAEVGELNPAGEISAAPGWDSCGVGRSIYTRFMMPNERRFRLTFKAPPVGKYDFKLAIKADGAKVREIRVTGEILPSLNLPTASWVPPVKKVTTGPYKIGVTSFPHWRVQHYHPVWSRAPWRKSTLGWYDPGAPETVDWHIKYLAENGVSWMMICWYFKAGELGENPWIETFQKSRYRHNLQWCLQWGIYGGLEVNDEAKMRKVARIWCERYFKTPEYLKFEGRPIVNIFNAHLIDKDRAKVRALLAALTDEVKKAGFPGLYLCGQRDQSAAKERFEHLAALGIERTTTYKFIRDTPLDHVIGFVDYHEIAMNSPGHWRRVLANSPIPSFPSLSTGYDMRPWHGEIEPDTTLNINVADFRYICQEAKRFSDESGERYLLVGPLDEWGEGSIGYPNYEHKFGILESIRDTFGDKPAEGWPLNYCPEDVGLSVPQWCN